MLLPVMVCYLHSLKCMQQTAPITADFAFCWEDKKCDKPCSNRERKLLFCWRAMLDKDARTPRFCDPCEYRLKWVRGEYTVDAFVKKYNRRSRARDVKKVLVIDDDPHILYALEDTVTHLGFECVSACDAEDGLVLARGIRPDLIVTDIILPKFDGFELCRRLQINPATSGIPVIIVTARDRKKDAQDGLELGARAFLRKPFRSSELSDHIQTALLESGPARPLQPFPPVAERSQ
jgi:CheY-like chemotaxis protein